jgi:hypothetical protein
MQRLRSWTTNEFVLTVFFWVCLSLSAVFYLLAGAERTAQIKLIEHQSGLISSDGRLARR